MAVQAKIIFRSGVLSGSVTELTRDLLRIGRDPANDLVVDDIEVSRNHAKISFHNDEYLIEDLNSTNGTLLNGRKIHTSEKLKDGDLINLGESNIFEFSLEKIISPKKKPAVKTDENFDEGVDQDLFSQMKAESESDTIEDAESQKLEEAKLLKKFSQLPTWVVILVIALGFIILFCIIPLLFIEITNQWCNLFSGFFNAITPGTCP